LHSLDPSLMTTLTTNETNNQQSLQVCLIWNTKKFPSLCTKPPPTLKDPLIFYNVSV
jgi:hypothetical protein